MAEYIEREPFIRDLTAMKTAYDAIALDGMIKALQAAPAVELVRCKDCKHYNFYRAGGKSFCTNPFWNNEFFPETNETDFCSRGEPRRKKCVKTKSL